MFTAHRLALTFNAFARLGVLYVASKFDARLARVLTTAARRGCLGRLPQLKGITARLDAAERTWGK